MSRNFRGRHANRELAVNIIEEIIDANSDVFVQGNTFDQQWLMQHTGRLKRYDHQHNPLRHAFDLLHVYSSINKVLAPRGLYIAARDYYSYWEVLRLEDAPKRIKTYDNVIKGSRKARDIYRRGTRTHRAVWSELTEDERNEAQSRLGYRVGTVAH